MQVDKISDGVWLLAGIIFTIVLIQILLGLLKPREDRAIRWGKGGKGGRMSLTSQIVGAFSCGVWAIVSFSAYFHYQQFLDKVGWILLATFLVLMFCAFRDQTQQAQTICLRRVFLHLCTPAPLRCVEFLTINRQYFVVLSVHLSSPSAIHCASSMTSLVAMAQSGILYGLSDHQTAAPIEIFPPLNSSFTLRTASYCCFRALSRVAPVT